MKIAKDWGLDRFAMAVAVLGVAALSRFVFAQEVADILGSHALRAVVEHGLDGIAFQFWVSGMCQLLSPSMGKNEGWIKKGISIGSTAFYGLLLLNWENGQAVDLGRSIQVDQLVGSGVGIGVGAILVGWVNSLK